jgi:ParB family chromosome partitioning protein
VRSVDGGYELIAGERRWRAAQLAGLKQVPVVVRDVSARESLELALIENVQREDLNAIEEARAYELLIEEMELTQEQVAQRVGRGRATVANYLRLLRLPEKVQGMVVDRKLEMGHARALLALDDTGAQIRLALEAVAKGLNVRQVEARVRSHSARPGKGGGRSRRDPDIEAAERKLSRAVGAPVTIRGKERGRLEIRFGSLDELNRLYEALLELNGS